MIREKYKLPGPKGHFPPSASCLLWRYRDQRWESEELSPLQDVRPEFCSRIRQADYLFDLLLQVEDTLDFRMAVYFLKTKLRERHHKHTRYEIMVRKGLPWYPMVAILKWWVKAKNIVTLDAIAEKNGYNPTQYDGIAYYLD